ncbi:MAG: nuclear transport factor 2 family protein [Chitinophagaceae bacterium]
MNNNQQIIQRFYTAFQQMDYKTMQDCYSEEPVFSDPAFGLLQGREVKAMWEMLCKNATNFSLSFSNIRLLDEEYATCDWIATYTFSKTGRNVINIVKAHMRIQDGKITEHTDKFDMWKWSRQALGMPGLLLGWSNFIQGKVNKNARKSLEKFMAGERK